MSNLFDYSQTPASNSIAPPDGAPEGMLPSGVNNVIRQLMAAAAGAFKCYTAGGTADAQTVTMDPTLAAYSNKVRIAFIPVGSNTGACTLNVNGLGAVSIKNLDGNNPPAGALNATMVAVVQHNGTNFVLLNPYARNTGVFTTIELGHASDTTLSRSAAGTMAVEGVDVPTISSTHTLTNKTFSGGTITGTIAGSPTVTGQWTFSGSTPALFTNADDGAAESPIVRLRRTSTTPAANDNLAELRWEGSNDALSAVSLIKFIGRTLDPTAGSEDSALIIQHRIAGTLTPTATIGPGLQLGGPTGGDKGVGTLNATGIYVNNVDVSTNSTTSTHTCQQLELGAATDTTLTRPAAGRAQIEGREIVTAAASATVLTSTIAELNILDGVTADATEINQLDGFGLKGYITGFVPTIAADTDHDLTFSSGACRNAADTISCKPSWSTLTKQIDAAFAEGTNAGGMATGAVANSTAYYYNLIRKNADPTVFDICIDVSSSNANTPSGWTFMREIHREFTDGSANLRVQTYSEVTGGGLRSKLGTVLTGFTDTNPGTNLVTKALAVPPGVEVRGTLVIIDATPASATYIVFTEVGSTATEPDVNNYTLFVGGAANTLYAMDEIVRFVDASRNIEYELSQSTADHSVWFQIFSWVNHRRN